MKDDNKRQMKMSNKIRIPPQITIHYLNYSGQNYASFP